MNRLIYLFSFVLIIFGTGCKKERIGDKPFKEESPVFYFKGNVSSVPVNLEAGVNNYYMYSFYKQDSSNGLYSVLGNLREVNCTNCSNHVIFQLNNNRLSPIGSPISNIDTLLQPDKFEFLQDTALLADVINFTAIPSIGDTVQSYYWDFGDGTNSTMANPSHTYKPGYYNACLRITYTNGCIGSICNWVKMGIQDSCSVNILDTPVPGTNIIQFDVNSTSALTYNWDFDDTLSVDNYSTLKSPSHEFSSPGIYYVRLAAGGSGCSYVTRKTVATSGYSSGCFANFTAVFVPKTSNPFSKIIVTWVDAMGQKYTSNNVLQPADSYFEIVSVEDYTLNEKGEPTKKITAKFKCLVSNGKTSIPITDADAVFAISYR